MTDQVNDALDKAADTYNKGFCSMLILVAVGTIGGLGYQAYPLYALSSLAGAGIVTFNLGLLCFLSFIVAFFVLFVGIIQNYCRAINTST